MTFQQLDRELRKLLGLYDTWVKRLMLGGCEKDDAEYSVKHFLEVFAENPDIYRDSFWENVSPPKSKVTFYGRRLPTKKKPESKSKR